MADLMRLLASSIDADTIKKIGAKLGADESTTKDAIGAALPALLGALQRNASSKEGADKLHEAAKQHDGRVLDNVAGMLGNSGDGAKILQHVLGAAQPKVNLGLAKLANLDPSQSNALLEGLAPVVMGAVGKTQREQGMDANGLAQALSKEASPTPAAGGLASAFDADSDGDVDLSDLLAHGKKFLG